MSTDPVETNPEFYRVLFENDRVRVLEYSDHPGDSTRPHSHPDSVMVALSDIHRRIVHDDAEREVEIPIGTASWLPAQEHSGHNIGTTETRAVIIELKHAAPPPPDANPGGARPLGPEL